tara:strand:+ start:3871 stop:4314 length:444 start_codon:yes stop_codon:yes gene_type:complete
MEFHLVKLNVAKSYLSLVDPNAKPRFICFSEKPIAEKCVDYVADFRSRHGEWPCLDMSQSNRRMESKPVVKLRTPEQVKRYLEIETYDFKTLDQIACRTNVSFYCVLNFDAIVTNNSENMSFSGQEMDGDADHDKFVEWMNFNLKIR